MITGTPYFFVQIKRDTLRGVYSGYIDTPPAKLYAESKDLSILYDNLKRALIDTNDGEREDLPELVGVFVD